MRLHGAVLPTFAVVPAIGLSPEPAHERMIVVARHNENVRWVAEAAARWTGGYKIYAPAKGREAAAYLRFVIDHYEHLPEWSFMCHANETAWHHDGTLGERLESAWQLATGTDRTFIEINNFRQPAGLDKARGPLLSNDETDATRRVTVARLDEWRREYLAPVPFEDAPADWVRGSVCCAQFLVHRSQIAQYPRTFYEALYAWSSDPARDDYVEGRFLEYAWHVIWGDEAARFPDPTLRHREPRTRFERAQREEEHGLEYQDEL